MISLALRLLCPTFWAASSAVEEYIEDSNRHYRELAKLNQEVEISICTVAWLIEE